MTAVQVTGYAGAQTYILVASGAGTVGDPYITTMAYLAGAYQSGSVASGALASGSIASGALASGAFASGAVASGAYASGSIATGAVVDLGVAGDAASATGTIAAKLRFIASTGIPITGTVTVGSHAVTNAGTFAVQPGPTTSGGLTLARDIDLDNGTLTVIKGSAGQLYGWSITNTSTVTVFVKFYDAASGTLGTGTPVLTIGIPGNATDDTLAMQNFGGMGLAFATGICVGAGTGVGDADNTDPGANAVVANFFYK